MRKLTRSHSTCTVGGNGGRDRGGPARSEEHTSELQSRSDLVCRLLLEKKKRTHRADLTGMNAYRELATPFEGPRSERPRAMLAWRFIPPLSGHHNCHQPCHCYNNDLQH